MKNAKTKSQESGTNTSALEVSHVSSWGLWLLIDDREYFLGYDRFPWFKDATIAQILNVTRPQPHHLFWPDLDVDLELDSLAHPEKFPFIYR